jgi:hypothetical protein
MTWPTSPRARAAAAAPGPCRTTPRPGSRRGEWAGKGAAALGLSGQVDQAVIACLFQQGIGPSGELLVKRRRSKAAGEREAAAVAAYRAAHPYASAVELAEVRAAERGNDPRQVPYFDLTVSAVKSVSVLHASYRVSARQAREHGDSERAAALDAKADQIEDALMDSARDAVAWLERHATYTRTGHHSARTGEWRDGTAWSPACSCTTCPATATRSCTCTSRSGTGRSAPTAPTTNGAPWTPAACTTSGSAPRRSPTGAWRPGCPPSATPWSRGKTATAPRSAGSART